MKILLLGKNGQVGWELQRSLAVLGEVVAWDRREADFAAPATLTEVVRRVAPDVIVNAAAYTAVDRAESEANLARTVNAESPAVLGREAARSGAWLLHFSTDYVFDGSGNLPWREDAPTKPLSIYGRTKLEGEEGIRASGCRHLILRTSWVYGARGGNFAKKMLRFAQELERLKVVADQFGVPTSAELLADLSAHLLRSVQAHPELGGTYHAVPAGETSWHAYATHVIEFALAAGVPIRVTADAIEAVPTEGFATAAKRPLNSRLDTRKLRDTFGLALPDWRQGVDRMLAEVLGR